MEDSQIIICKSQSDIPTVKEEMEKMILNRQYPIVKGVPFCCLDMQHVSDLFFGTGKGKKKEACKDCILKRWCDYDSEDFEINTIESCDPDLIKFLEERDENIADWI